jgi:hypothetical protein
MDYTGGNFIHGNKLVAYLTTQPFEFKFQRTKKEIKKSKFDQTDIQNKMTYIAFSLKPKQYKKKGLRTHRFHFKPKKNLLKDLSAYSSMALPFHKQPFLLPI